MSTVGQRERLTQQQVLRFFQGELGYHYLGDWKDRGGNRNIEEDLLRDWLVRQSHEERVINRALRELDQAAAISGSKTLYDANRAVYEKLRYGVHVKPSVQEQTVTVWLIDWANPENNDFAVAEEVTVSGVHNKRPDVVLYVNGIALGILELKRSTVAVAEGIRQSLDNQKPEFIQSFFATAQLVMAGNPTEGLRYGVIETPEKFWMEWKEPSDLDDPLARGLHQLCRKERLLEIVHDFMVFDAGVKKTCRHNQFFGVRAAQDHVQRRQGGIIWHTQGSGKSLTMVWLAKWIRENVQDARVLVITDRTELDEQIEKVFKGVDEQIHRTRSGADLIDVLNRSDEWLIASLIHKFGASEEGDVDAFIQDMRSHLPKGFWTKGNLFVFVDECHRTQSGKLHEAMKVLLPEAMLIGFTGTPLLKKDKRKSIEVFGPYIHSYKFDEAVQDGVVLDLRYEARDIDQHVTSQARIDQWFELKTKGLNDYARAQLKKRWGTLQKVLSSRDRLEKIVSDILWDMATRDRLMSGHGNAMLVAGSIYSACRLFEMFEKTELKGKCAIVTSYVPSTANIKGEATGEGETEKLHQYEIYRRMLAEHFNEPEDTAVNKVETFEQEVKKRFIDEPGQMKLLIVVDKLLTGFDAPPATYLYIDKQMRDHGLFQAICRVNRLHTEDKEVGYIVDYKDLFKSLEQSIQDYTGGAFDAFDSDDVEGLLEDRLDKARERLEEAREAIKALCEGVAPPKDSPAYRHYFVGPSDAPEVQKENEPRRLALYKHVGAFLRAYADLANEMQQAGYSKDEVAVIKSEVEHYEQVREEVKLASGDYIDMKMYEPAMRHLLDTYIRADESEKLSAFDDMTLVELVVERGEEAVDSLPSSISGDREAMAETIENNVRRLIIDEMAVNPKYYEKMSELLDALIEQRRQEALEYKEYLSRIVELTRQAARREEQIRYPTGIETSAQQALYDNLAQDAMLAIRLDEKICAVKKADWRGNKFKEREVRNAIASVLETKVRETEILDVDTVLELVKNQNDY
ncbi:type I restriction endonuclease subunit R [Chromohalobacter israelensis]|uniref:type I restriction endonuclease subunit R n=1 Tax=Chromohalobacter israelensis TaxID=141390 RepID=UPI00054F5F66|nr:type I restriction endonuclease subunit R [Chromohalobacter israelensis]MDF9434779.1 type I restriction endonuclease subunit R [Chromohalobacter israelensis]